MKILYVIPARGGSKGIPGKNIKPLVGKPLIFYAIDTAKAVTAEEHICVTTDDYKIIETVESYGLKIPFKRPPSLATDRAGMYEVLLHAIKYYEDKGLDYDVLILLQPTSPFRKPKHVLEAIKLYREDMDMVVSVKETSANPYYVLFEEDENGFLRKAKEGNFSRRQDCPKVYEFNGAIYVINIKSLKREPIYQFKKVIKYEMDEFSSVDIDTNLDWYFAEFLSEKGIVK